MSTASFLLIAMAYVNGNPVEIEADNRLYDTTEKCVAEAKRSAESVRQTAPLSVQFVYKCIDISQSSNATSVFGTLPAE